MTGERAKKRCYLCGREGVSAYRPHRVEVGAVEIEVQRCSNYGACGDRRCRQLEGHLMGIGIAEFTAARERAQKGRAARA